MATAQQFFELWTRDKQLREQGTKRLHSRTPARGANHTRRKIAFAAIKYARRKLALSEPENLKTLDL